MNPPLVNIGRKKVGPGQPCFVIAEMSGNHGGSLERALQIVRAASKAGANALKMQTYTADTITLDLNIEDFQLKLGPWKSHKRLWDLYHTAHTPWEWHLPVFTEARRLGMEVFSSPFDESAVDFLESLDACAYKIASPEINHIPLLRRVARTGKPVILSTGLARLADIELALETLRNAGAQEIILLKCTTAYPAPVEETDLRTIPDMAQRFCLLSGLSDHSIGTAVAVAAVALGANVIEKHFTLDDEEDTVDSFFSLNQNEFKRLVDDIRIAEVALGRVSYEIAPSAQGNLRGMRSLYVSAPIRAGETLNPNNIRCVRPSMGLHPKYYESILGRRSKRDLIPGERLLLEDLE
jgi:N-acetylneuraminate synthase/pseudaminic acid synthase